MLRKSHVKNPCASPCRLLNDAHTLYGFGEDVAKVKKAWAAGGAKASTEAVSEKLLTELGHIGGLEGAIERLKAQDEGGVDVHKSEIDASSPAEFERIVARLL